MAGREINIPFGPDKTGGMELAPLAPEGAAEPTDPFAEPPLPEARAAEDSRVEAEPQPSTDEPRATAPAKRVPVARGTRRSAEADSAPVQRNMTDEEAAAQGMDDMQRSIAALRDSFGQGRELRAREKERKELAEALDADHVELADRENILSNYHAIVAEQDSIIDAHTQRRETRKQELAGITAQMDQVQQQLAALREQHAQQLQPLESELGRVRAMADQTKNDERSRKSELSAAESELRRTSDADGNTMAVAQHQQVLAAYEEARKRSEQAKEQLAQVQQAYDDAKAQAEQAEGPLERSISDLSEHAETLKNEINELGEEISVARKRRQYCDNVYQYPDETAQMRTEVEAAEATARQMDVETNQLRTQLAATKQEAKKAKIALGVLAAVLILAVIAFVVIQLR